MSVSQRHPRTWTIRDLLTWTTGYFAERGIATARLDSEVLLAHAMGTNRLGLYLRLDGVVPPEVLEAYRSSVRRRAQREPVAYITGEKEFYGLPFRVTREVLIPRPETELLVECVLRLVQESPHLRSPRLLDVGTGCGAIAIALAHELRSREPFVVATDISDAALDVARANAERLGVSSRIVFRRGDLLEAVESGETFFAVLTNLPYIPAREIASLEPEVAQYEPRRALDGGDDGLALIRRLIDDVPQRLEEGGWLAMEVGVGQASAVVERIRATNAFGETKTIRDYAQVERIVLAQKRQKSMRSGFEGEGSSWTSSSFAAADL